MTEQVWIVGVINYDKWEVTWAAWQFVGVFDSEEKAVAACKTNRYFVAPYTVNEVAPEEARPIPGGYYPLAQNPTGLTTDSYESERGIVR